jgi:DNA-binding Lrp family transcriptional regulator
MESEAVGDWRAAIDDVDARLLDAWQSGLPIAPRPFESVGDDLSCDAAEAVERVRSLQDRGLIRRFGPVLNPPAIGSSALAALRVPDGDIESATAAINRHDAVNHNYRRDHEWSLWFVVTAASEAHRSSVLDAIRHETGHEPLVLPMLTDYYVDLEFPVVNLDDVARADTRAAVTRMSETAAELSATEARVIEAVQEGLPISPTPYADVASGADLPPGNLRDALRSLHDRRCIKRIGCVVDHRRVGFDSNCMVVWDVPDGERDHRGVEAGAHPNVTLCYHRPRRPERDWPYNLFTMIHGRDSARVEATIDELAADVLPVPHERLRTTATLKQTGARYESLVAADD